VPDINFGTTRARLFDVTDPRIERTRTRALEAARRLLVEEGVDAVTHLRVAEAGGGGRRTLYRHWPDATALLRDTLTHGEVPHAPVTGDLRADLVAHLDALRRALVEGHLGFVISLLGERSRTDATFELLRDELTEAGCEPLRRMLRAAVRSGTLPSDLDVPAAMAALEGPVFYRCMVRRERFGTKDVDRVVDAVLSAPPRRLTREGRRAAR
jgi:AcrR family transcriptional regulator